MLIDITHSVTLIPLDDLEEYECVRVRLQTADDVARDFRKRLRAAVRAGQQVESYGPLPEVDTPPE